jgi:hypothetical protein
MVVSIAMLGVGTAGTVLAIVSARSQFADQRFEKQRSIFRNISEWICSESVIPLYALTAGVSIILSYLAANRFPFDPVRLSWEKWQILYLFLYCTILSVPFLFSALLIASMFLHRSERAKSIYSADLLGAGLGSISVLALLHISGPENPVICASVMCLTGTCISGKRTYKVAWILLILFNIILLTAGHDILEPRLSPYKKLSNYLKYPGAEHMKTYNSSYSRIDVFKSPAVRLAPGLSLKYLDPLPEQTGMAVDGDRITVVTDVSDKSTLHFLSHLPSSAAYEITQDVTVLVIDPGGGLQALMAAYYKAKEVHKVESNPLLLKIIRDDLSEFSGGIYGENTWTGLGRNRLSLMNSDKYDIIDIPMMGISVSGSFGISEDYRYTVNAFEKYLAALKRDGMLSISLYIIPPARTEFRLLATLLSAFERMGIDDASGRIVAIRSWDSMTILAAKTPFSKKELAGIKEFSGSRRFDMLYYQGIKKEESNTYIKYASDNYYEGFISLIDREKRLQFIDNYLFDISPVTDNSPFSGYYIKLENIKAIYKTMGHNWLYFMDEGYMLPFILAILVISCVIIISLPAVSKPIRTKLRTYHRSVTASTMVYFAMLGLGFMFLEVSLMQKHILLLENPSYSFSVMLTAILISSGAGSYVSRRHTGLSSPFFILVLSAAILGYSYMYPFLLHHLVSQNLMTKILLLSLSVIPIGFLMGIPFPTGLTLLGKKHGSLIPWAWAINACFSVLAPVLSVAIALSAGFDMVLHIASVAYFFAFISLLAIRRNT